MANYWTCRRQVKGERCGTINTAYKTYCDGCGRPRQRRSRPKHRLALKLPYEEYVRLNGGENCAICGREPTERRHHDRDHDHLTGKPRGLLCHRCNRTLPSWITTEWLQSAIHYLERSKT